MGALGFGSCVLTFGAGSAQYASGEILTVNPCSFAAATAGLSTGSAHTVPVTINMGGVTSNPVNFAVTISSTGAVQINGQTVGMVSVTAAGGAGN